jgi:coenzyme F420-reducing hydrogenase gamma subunit
VDKELKTCALCEETKNLTEFSKNTRYKDGLYKHCKKCHYEVYGRSSHYRRTYGITQEDYNILLSNQGYKCFGCGSAGSNEKIGRLFVDHCHTTGKVRGLLCQGCNFAIGAVKDNTETLKNLIQYLEKNNGA